MTASKAKRSAATAHGAAGFLSTETRLRRLLLASDLSARSDRALERGIALARQHRAHLTILHVIDEELPEVVRNQLAGAAEAEIEAALEKFGAPDGFDVSICVLPGRDYRDILDTAENDACDLIILGGHRNESWDRPLHGTTMERVIRHGVRPVLVVAERTAGPYENVMLGIDFSIFSRFAVRAALTVAPQAAFHFVHAFQVPFAAFLPGREVRTQLHSQYDEALMRVIDEEMGAFLKARGVEEANNGKKYRVLRSGEVTSVLRSEAARINPDLLVIGTHGRVGIAHAILGSVAENLLNRPPCDVLAVKAW